MRTGVSTASLYLRADNEEALPLLGTLGVKTAEVFLTSYSEYEEKFGELLAKRKGQVCVHSVHVLNTQFEPQLFNVNPRAREDSFFWLRKAMAAGRALGAKYYTFHGTARMKKGARSGAKDDFDLLGAGLERIFRTCEEYGITLCLENVEWALYNRPGVFSELKRRCPGLLGVLDIKQARISCYPWGMYLKEMEGALAHVHVSDHDGMGHMCLPGRGVTDFKELLKRLNGAGFDGPLIVEVYRGDYGEVEELAQACEYLDEMIYRYGF